MPNAGDVEAAFEPYLEPDESLKHCAYGVRGLPPLVFLPLYLLGIVPGMLARALLTTPYLFGLTNRRLVVLRFRGYLHVKESYAYARDQLPPIRSKRTLFAAILAIDDAERPLTVRFGLFTAHNSDRHVRELITGLERGPEKPPPPPMKPEDALSPRFKAVRQDLLHALGEARASDFLDMPIYHRKGTTPYAVFGEGYTSDPTRKSDGYSTACLVKNTVFANAFDLDAPCWFVFTNSRYAGTYSEYGPIPPEAPSIWDESGLLPPALKAEAEDREIVKVDPYTLNGQVYVQWILHVKPGEIGIDTLHQASARLWHGSEDEPGPRLKEYLFCLQPGLPLVYLVNVPDGACVLLSQYSGVIRPYAQQFKDWVTASSSEIISPASSRSGKESTT